MTEIRSFQALHYNPEKSGDLSKVVCPPYDVISPVQQKEYYAKSKNNFIRVMLAHDQNGDDEQNNRYTRAQETFEQWIAEGIIEQDEKPGIYFYKQEYKVLGTRHSRLGFISLMRVQDDKDSRVFPHEKTHAQAKEDRLRLWSALKANLSSIFVCFSDKDKKIEKIFNKQVVVNDPFIDVMDEDDVRHQVWRLDDPVYVNQIVETLDQQQLFIADGHHRYEVAKFYRRQQIAQGGAAKGTAAYNYIMTYFTNMDSRDLQIFPMHRIVKSMSGKLDFLTEFFRIDKIRSKDDMVILLGKAGQNEHAFILYTKDEVLLLRLKNKALIDKYIPEGSKAYRHLDATILKHFILDRVDVQSEDIGYTKSIQDVMGAVESGEAQAGFIMNAVKVKQLRDIALNGERMPPKTTYFYPKVLSGLTVYKMD